MSQEPAAESCPIPRREVSRASNAISIGYTRHMLMVIFGAGASYDSSPTYAPGMSPPGADSDYDHFHRPPLAKELFADRPLFRDALDAFPQCKPIVPRLRDPKVTSGDISIEALLQEIEREAEAYHRARHELAAIRFYLQRVIYGSETRWLGITRGITNYLSLLREIERTFPKEPVCLVTFNYDTLLEHALRHFGLPIASIDDYTKRHAFYRVFKLHGSTSWVREIETRVPIDMRPSSNPEATIYGQLMEQLAEIHITDRYVFSPHDAIGISLGRPVFPAIAIPVQRKGSFECPQYMVEELTALLAKVTQILVIGWRATEAHFLELLHQHLRWGSGLYFCIVAGNLKEAEGVKDRINRAFPGSQLSISPETTGFTEFVLTRRAEQVLGVLPSAP